MMKRVLLISKHKHIRGPMAAAYLKQLAKCPVHIGLKALEPKALHPHTGAALAFEGLSGATKEAGTNSGAYDYVITLCDEARYNTTLFEGQPLHFHYHFRELREDDSLELFVELRDTIKQYLERFCKMYLNEFS
jgi:protein-tyrosine-phosphatase